MADVQNPNVLFRLMRFTISSENKPISYGAMSFAISGVRQRWDAQWVGGFYRPLSGAVGGASPLGPPPNDPDGLIALIETDIQAEYTAVSPADARRQIVWRALSVLMQDYRRSERLGYYGENLAPAPV